MERLTFISCDVSEKWRDWQTISVSVTPDTIRTRAPCRNTRCTTILVPYVDGGDGDGGDGDGGDGDGGDGVGYDCRSRVPLVEGMTTGGKKHLANGDNLGNLHPGSLHTRT